MRLVPVEPEIPEGVGFTAENDIFGYRPFGERLLQLVRNIEGPAVLTLDGDWGSGKSIFIQQWAEMARGQGAPVIYFDAFGSDHFEDAFLALSSEIITAAEVIDVGQGEDNPKDRFLGRVVAAGKVVAPFALKVLTRAATAGALDLEDIKDLGKAGEDVAGLVQEQTDKLIESTIENRIQDAKVERQTLEGFRESLADLASAASDSANENEDLRSPLIFIIDDLDRCRPPFAISIIERIKHFFAVDGVVFLLVTHLPQLETAIQGAYGAEFDAGRYLEKFYHLRLQLPTPLDPKRSQRKRYLKHLIETYAVRHMDGRLDELMWEEVEFLVDKHGLSLRTVSRVVTTVSLAAASAPANHLFVAPLVAGLSVMKSAAPDLYALARAGNLRHQEAIEFVAGDDDAREWGIDWWRFATRGGVTNEKHRLGMEREVQRYNFRQPDDLITHSVGQIEAMQVQDDRAED